MARNVATAISASEKSGATTRKAMKTPPTGGRPQKRMSIHHRRQRDWPCLGRASIHTKIRAASTQFPTAEKVVMNEPNRIVRTIAIGAAGLRGLWNRISTNIPAAKSAFGLLWESQQRMERGAVNPSRFPSVQQLIGSCRQMFLDIK